MLVSYSLKQNKNSPTPLNKLLEPKSFLEFKNLIEFHWQQL